MTVKQELCFHYRRDDQRSLKKVQWKLHLGPLFWFSGYASAPFRRDSSSSSVSTHHLVFEPHFHSPLGSLSGAEHLWPRWLGRQAGGSLIQAEEIKYG